MSTAETDPGRRLEVDVAILGGDPASLTTALVAAKAGLRVAVCSPTALTAQGWAEVSVLQGLQYQRTRHLLGDGAVISSLTAAAEARDWLNAFLVGDGQAVVRQVVQAGLWVVDGHEANQLHTEAQAMHLADVVPQFTDECELPFQVRPVLTLPDQLLIDRESYYAALVAAVHKAGAHVLEAAPVVSGSTHDFVVDGPTPTHITTSRVVVADGVAAPTKAPVPHGSAVREYAIELDTEHPINHLWYGLEDEVTVTPGTQPGRIIISGAAHAGSIPRESELAYASLAEFGRVHFGTTDPVRRWSRLHYTSTDHLPLVGAAGVLAPFIFVLGGIGRWDVLSGTAAGLQLGRYLSGASTDLPFSPVHVRGGSPKALVARLRAWLPGAR